MYVYIERVWNAHSALILYLHQVPHLKDEEMQSHIIRATEVEDTKETGPLNEQN